MSEDVTLIAVILGGMVSAILVWKYVKKIAITLWNRLYIMFGYRHVEDKLMDLSKQVQLIALELKPNGGTSLRDTVDRIEDRLILTDQRHRALISNMDIGVFEVNGDDRCVWVNMKFCRMSGRIPQQVLGKGWFNCVSSNDRTRVRREWNCAIKEEREFDSEFLLETPEGDKILVHGRTYKMCGRGKKAIGYMGMFTPIKEYRNKHAT